MFFNRKEIDELYARIENYKGKIKDLNKTIEDLNRSFSPDYNCSVAIDFDMINAFCVERHPGIGSNTNPRTIIGYKDKDNVTREWCLYCSVEVHEEVVKKFNEYLATKNFDVKP